MTDGPRVLANGSPVAGTSLVDLLDRVVDTGVALSGDLVISLAGIDLIRLDLRLLLIGIDAATRIESAGRGTEAA